VNNGQIKELTTLSSETDNELTSSNNLIFFKNTKRKCKKNKARFFYLEIIRKKSNQNRTQNRSNFGG